MFTMMLVAVSLAAAGPVVLWQDACQVAESGLNVPASGDYHVWVWTNADTDAQLIIAGHALRAKRESKKPEGHEWVRAGKLQLDAGQVAAELPSTVASVALSTSADFTPLAALGDMRVYDQPESVRDRRAETAKHTDTIFTMTKFDSLEEWTPYAENLRRRILVSSGLWPLPPRTPLNARVFDRITHDDYTIEKVCFEARPGVLVTGNLYRPVGTGPFPGMACPHGHWKNGRLENSELCSVPGRCITFARMGIVAFAYDMEGYVDNLQYEDHHWANDREKLWGIHPYAVQLWAGIRAVDFLQDLPDVDPERIGCTGASGGGTQTFSLAAVDPRVKAAAPVNMISHSMQGGCICENAPILRLSNSNMEIGALMAPRPLMMVSATGDWTRETPRIEYPAIRGIYALYGSPDRVEQHQVKEEHNYNRESREAVYRFFGKWLLDGSPKWEQFTEPPFTVEESSKLRVFPDGKLPDGLPKRKEIVEQTIEANRAKWDAVMPKNPYQAGEFRDQYGVALTDTLGATIPCAREFDSERVGFEERDKYVVERWILRRPKAGDAVPALLYRAYSAEPQDAVLVVHGSGKAALADQAAGGPGPLVQRLLDRGRAVMVIDTFLTGEHNDPHARAVRFQQGEYMDTFQPTDTALRVQDVVTALAYLRSRDNLSDAVDLIGVEEAGMLSLLASAVYGRVRTTVIDANQFNTASDEEWLKSYYVPCIRSVGDVQTAGAMIAPRPLTLVNTGRAFQTDGIQRAYSVVHADTLKIQTDPVAMSDMASLVP